MGFPDCYGGYPRTIQPGPLNLITDVSGVQVGHATLSGGDIHTGVTVLLPHGGDIFHEKCRAAVHVINGYGKSAGLVQVAEMGTVETPLFFTSTLSVGTVSTAAVRYMLERNADIGRGAGTVNPVVFECNDGTLNDIRLLSVQEPDVFRALESAGTRFEEGAVGAGAGMCCYDLKGGIGSSSRVFQACGRQYTLGTLLLTNFGALDQLLVAGTPVGRRYLNAGQQEPERGSCIVVLATDAPLSGRQLLRVAKRAQSGLARTGSCTGNGSGEIALAFSTAGRVPHASTGAPLVMERLHDNDLNMVFRAAVESTEESVLSSMIHAPHTVGRGGVQRKSLREVLDAVDFRF